MRAVLLVLTAVMAVSACNTVKGIGRDIESAADAVEEAVSD